MKYLLGVFVPVVIQVLVIWLIIDSNTGNGSWAGLGALLIGMVAVPLTAIVNSLILKRQSHGVGLALLQCYLVAVLSGFVVMIFMLVG